jgi:hypothetical protein
MHPRLSSVDVGGKEQPIKVEVTIEDSRKAAIAAIEEAFKTLEG